ncbi:NAD(P)H-hydrate dehydratase [Stenomitos frigidus]|uniref:Bifunctional NAD(P)H-hydrate repair enzyme n=1 Tax=Stenomitos frigidus ULC18 TaxID=2107698 RepID=A0A2T1DYK1_9CYAN|nr:NAD(P)H-hydrate dehydratase [Stenomitos frigidus]PSB25539.1 bifunctional ADP-dependent NAD(P)H-hydrate dehydratase/NAD(P)H-hydrate epimerase [Stenomitos frigidus ULC18]
MTASTVLTRIQSLQQIVVTAAQMRQIEERIFAAGLPVEALMEKAAGLIARRVKALYADRHQHLGVLVGPGHNGGDALVVARELHLDGYTVSLYCPFSNLKDLTAQQYRYCQSLGIPFVEQVDALKDCDVLIDGLFGFGLQRSLSGDIETVVNQINQWSQPVVSIDLPSGLHTDTGAALGTAVCATHTLCLGLWKQGLLQDQALDYAGSIELIDFGVPLTDVWAVLGKPPSVRRITPEQAIAHLPLARPAATHKYKMGHVLLICGSRRYAGGALLTALGARASGVGMLSIAAPKALKATLTAQLPEALVWGCDESETGAIAQLPDGLDLSVYHAIACGPGLTMDAHAVIQQVLSQKQALVLDADGLNFLAQQGTIPTLQTRQAPTVITPHLGEFKRLFPDLADPMPCRIMAAQAAAAASGAVVLLKGARVAIADPEGTVWINPQSTAALARGGSGDVLTGLLGGLLAQTIAAPSPSHSILDSVLAGAWWHAQAGILAMQERTLLGVDAFTLSQYLLPALIREI